MIHRARGATHVVCLVGPEPEHRQAIVARIRVLERGHVPCSDESIGSQGDTLIKIRITMRLAPVFALGTLVAPTGAHAPLRAGA